MASHGKRVHPVSQKARRKVLRAGTRLVVIPQYAPRDAEDPGPEHPWEALTAIDRQMTLFWSSAWADPFVNGKNNTGKPKLPRQDEPAYVKLTRKKRR